MWKPPYGTHVYGRSPEGGRPGGRLAGALREAHGRQPPGEAEAHRCRRRDGRGGAVESLGVC